MIEELAGDWVAALPPDSNVQGHQALRGHEIVIEAEAEA